MKGDKQLIIPLTISVVMLLFAVVDLPYGYYQILRFVICAVGVLSGYNFIRSDSRKVKYYGYVFGIIAITFNPFVPIHFEREEWRVLDIICAIYFAFVVYKIQSSGKLGDK